MKATIKIELQPFTVPNCVLAQEPPGHKEDGFKKARTYHLHELDEETIRSLCEEFVCKVYTKAGVDMPPTSA